MTTGETEPKPCTVAEPQAEHRWLEKLVGEWTYEGEAFMEPGKPGERFTGREIVWSLGGLWVAAEGTGEMPGGGEATMMLTLGYDPQKKRYVGTWVGSMMTHLWLYEGTLDAEGRSLTLDTEGPGMVDPGKMEKFRDVIGWKGDDHRTLTSHILGGDGRWSVVMTCNYRRVV